MIFVIIAISLLTKIFGAIPAIVITGTFFAFSIVNKINKPKYKKVMENYKANIALETSLGQQYDELEEEEASVNTVFSLNENLNTLPDKNGTLQLKKLSAIIDNFEEIISYQGNGDKATLLEYEQAVEQVDQAVQDNLQHYFLVMKSIEPFNNKLMDGDSIYSQDDKNELSQEWSNLCLKQGNRAKDILMKNEQAITQLYVFLTDIVNISFKKIPDYSMQEALDNLTQQIRQTEQYADEVMLSPYE